MTLRAMRLLSRLKEAQLRQDEIVYIDFDSLSAYTVHEEGQPGQIFPSHLLHRIAVIRLTIMLMTQLKQPIPPSSFLMQSPLS